MTNSFLKHTSFCIILVFFQNFEIIIKNKAGSVKTETGTQQEVQSSELKRRVSTLLIAQGSSLG